MDHFPSLSMVGAQPFGGGASESDLEEDGDDRDIFRGPQYEQVGLPTKQAEIQAFMDQKPQPRWKCFGCIYRDQALSGKLPRRRIDALMKKLLRCVGQMDDITLAFEIADDYAQIRRDVNLNLLPGQRKLPSWRARTILEHLDTHHSDPQYHQFKRLKQLREGTTIALHAAIQQDRETKKLRIEKDQWKCFLDGIKAEQQLMKLKPQDCAFYNEGSKIDAKAMSQGPVALTYKPMVDYLTRGNLRKE